jgi:cyanophycinase
VSPSTANGEASTRGYLIPIGGAENHDHPAILTRFVDLCGGDDAIIVVVPVASRMKDTGSRYVELFDELGVARASALSVRGRADADDPAHVDTIRRATGIFLTGGDQLRLSTLLGGTMVAQTIRRAHAGGTHVAGTSAGAAIMPEHMIAGGEGGPTPGPDKVTLAPGFGLSNRIVVDQHFAQRDRLGRLLTAVSYNPFLVGLGIDEDTAAFIAPDDTIVVRGSGAITVVDPSTLAHSSMSSARPGDPVTLLDLRLHILARGARYDLTHRTASLSGRAEDTRRTS